MSIDDLIKRLKYAYKMEQQSRKRGGGGVAKPFENIEDSLYGEVIDKLLKQQVKIDELVMNLKIIKDSNDEK